MSGKIVLNAMAREQEMYSHPLKTGTARRQHSLGSYNIQVIEKLRDLRDFMKAGPQ